MTLATLLGIVVAVCARYLATDKHDRWAVTGLGLGLGAGILIGANSKLGLWAIETFNPDLPPRDFQISFGTIVGGIVGAFVGTLVGGVGGLIGRWSSATSARDRTASRRPTKGSGCGPQR